MSQSELGLVVRFLCRQIRYCVDYGWCYCCDLVLVVLMSEVNYVIGVVIWDDGLWGELYVLIVKIMYIGDFVQVVVDLVELCQINWNLNWCVQLVELVIEKYQVVVVDWMVCEDGIYVLYDSLKVIGRLVGKEILFGIWYMQWFENVQQVERFIEQIYGLLEYWNILVVFFGVLQLWWWEECWVELLDVFVGCGFFGVYDSLWVQVWVVFDEVGVSQVEVFRKVGLFIKYMNQMFIGKVVFIFGWVEKILVVCGQWLEIRVVFVILMEEEQV